MAKDPATVSELFEAKEITDQELGGLPKTRRAWTGPVWRPGRVPPPRRGRWRDRRLRQVPADDEATPSLAPVPW